MPSVKPKPPCPAGASRPSTRARRAPGRAARRWAASRPARARPPRRRWRRARWPRKSALVSWNLPCRRKSLQEVKQVVLFGQLFPEERRQRYTHQHPLGAEQAGDRLAPGLLARRHKQAVAPFLQRLGRCLDVGDVEFDPGVRRRKVGGPLRFAEAGKRRPVERPEREMLHPTYAAGVEVIRLLASGFERQTQRVAV